MFECLKRAKRLKNTARTHKPHSNTSIILVTVRVTCTKMLYIAFYCVVSFQTTYFVVGIDDGERIAILEVN